MRLDSMESSSFLKEFLTFSLVSRALGLRVQRAASAAAEIRLQHGPRKHRALQNQAGQALESQEGDHFLTRVQFSASARVFVLAFHVCTRVNFC